jgi:iron complex transport system ATP-binding protein
MASQLQIDNIAFNYGKKTIFSGLNIEVSRGEILCVLGANGCGKTTLLRCINGALKLKAGQISLDDVDIASLGVLELARKIGIVFQEHNAPFPFSVLEVVCMGRAPHLSFFGSPSHRDTEIALNALELVGMSHLKDKPYTQISGGERQLVLIARTLAQEPAVILLDEPTSHLDFKNQALVLQMIDRLSKTGLITIMSTHLPNHAFLFSSKVALMSDGKMLAFGSSGDVMTEDNLYLTYGIDVKILTVNYTKEGKTVRFCVPKMETGEKE